MTPRALVLIVDDAPEVHDLLGPFLVAQGFEVLTARSGGEALLEAQAREPDLVVLDVGLPDIDGLEVCRRLRTFTHAAVLMLTARDDETDKIVGLRLGADDYVTKPFSLREVGARVDALLRRLQVDRASAAPLVQLRHEGIVVDTEAHEVRVDDRPVRLTRKEYELLQALVEHPRRVLTREVLLDRVWGDAWYGDAHVVDVHVSNLRRKIGGERILSVRGVGYRMAARDLAA